ncbi:MAG: type II toxin-antitoxin system HicB family antitoxin [Clostridiales bacterium]|nr:type II toxin-antitoxin system HicB family antitoxin [Clostridiales bacterium]
MKNNILEYKGYHTKIEFDSNEMVLRGKIEGINDLVNFESESVQKLEEEFHNAVDDYLDFCLEVGKTPDKEYKGTFNVRINPELHKKLAVVSFKNGDTLNASVEKAIEKYVSEGNEEKLENTIRILAEALRTESVCEYNEKVVYKNSNVVKFPSNEIVMTYGERRM